VLNQDYVQTLFRLGLTLRQAKVYLALCLHGISTVHSISKASKVARPDIYRVMVELQNRGLAEKIIDYPSKFKAIPIQEGISILLNRKTMEVYSVMQEAKELLKKLEKIGVQTKIKEEESQFVLIPEKETFIKRENMAIGNAQCSIDFVCPKEAFPEALLIMDKGYEKAMRRGVKIRWIVEEPKDRKSWPEILSTFINNPSFKFRALRECPEERLGMFDKKEVFIALNPTTAATESPALWTNNHSILKIVHDYFEILWITAIEEPQYSTHAN
jgi:sugar-specific transcriptional regulator TrmB